ncbi:oligosaccharide flippase family protein [Vibrio europaeus]|uniref:oligosaccharide flippase family protein n=1 Tax=Vibrio europaeus TaxID=300876 RepID=UPI00233F19E7|nr:oligosaccharide flippase family protein [Vibrio europaeus]MDC5855126.1 oligosaccharide flippase family protein [Vibrio europaeus]
MKYKIFSINLTSLYGIQAVLTLFPILIIPLLVSILGLTGYANYVLIAALFGMFETVVAYSFRTTATREASGINQATLMSELISSVLSIRLLLSIFALLAFYSSYVVIYSSRDMGISDSALCLALLIRLLGFILSSEWYFQATQNTSIYLLITLFSRVFFLVSLFLSIEDSLAYVLLMNSLMSLLVGLGALTYILVFTENTLVKPNVCHMKNRFIKGTDLFLSSLGVYFYTNINTVFVSSFLSAELVAVYSVAEKVYRGASSLFAPINKAFYPVLLKMRKTNFNNFSRLSVGILTVQIMLAVTMSISLDYFNVEILNYFLSGEKINNDAIGFFSHFVYLIVLFVASAFTTYILVILNLDKKIKNITAIFGVVNVVTVPLVLSTLPFIYMFWAVFFVMLMVALSQVILSFVHLRKGFGG